MASPEFSFCFCISYYEIIMRSSNILTKSFETHYMKWSYRIPKTIVINGSNEIVSWILVGKLISGALTYSFLQIHILIYRSIKITYFN